MKERPILFSGPMVRAIIEGRKTQTRRVASKINPDYLSLHCERGSEDWEENRMAIETGRLSAPLRCPYGAPGDTLWVRETWGPFEGGFIYRADEGPNVKPDDGRWHPSIHMPRDASRLTLRIKSVRVERLQEISQGDAQAEGLSGPMIDAELDAIVNQIGLAPSKAFRALWESINAKSHPWASNPWVWVVEFERVGGAS